MYVLGIHPRTLLATLFLCLTVGGLHVQVASAASPIEIEHEQVVLEESMMVPWEEAHVWSMLDATGQVSSSSSSSSSTGGPPPPAVPSAAERSASMGVSTWIVSLLCGMLSLTVLGIW